MNEGVGELHLYLFYNLMMRYIVRLVLPVAVLILITGMLPVIPTDITGSSQLASLTDSIGVPGGDSLTGGNGNSTFEQRQDALRSGAGSVNGGVTPGASLPGGTPSASGSPIYYQVIPQPQAQPVVSGGGSASVGTTGSGSSASVKNSGSLVVPRSSGNSAGIDIYAGASNPTLNVQSPTRQTQSATVPQIFPMVVTPPTVTLPEPSGIRSNTSPTIPTERLGPPTIVFPEPSSGANTGIQSGTANQVIQQQFAQQKTQVVDAQSINNFFSQANPEDPDVRNANIVKICTGKLTAADCRTCCTATYAPIKQACASYPTEAERNSCVRNNQTAEDTCSTKCSGVSSGANANSAVSGAGAGLAQNSIQVWIPQNANVVTLNSAESVTPGVAAPAPVVLLPGTANVSLTQLPGYVPVQVVPVTVRASNVANIAKDAGIAAPQVEKAGDLLDSIATNTTNTILGNTEVRTNNGVIVVPTAKTTAISVIGKGVSETVAGLGTGVTSIFDSISGFFTNLTGGSGVGGSNGGDAFSPGSEPLSGSGIRRCGALQQGDPGYVFGGGFNGTGQQCGGRCDDPGTTCSLTNGQCGCVPLELGTPTTNPGKLLCPKTVVTKSTTDKVKVSETQTITVTRAKADLGCRDAHPKCESVAAKEPNANGTVEYTTVCTTVCSNEQTQRETKEHFFDRAVAAKDKLRSDLAAALCEKAKEKAPAADEAATCSQVQCSKPGIKCPNCNEYQEVDADCSNISVPDPSVGDIGNLGSEVAITITANATIDVTTTATAGCGVTAPVKPNTSPAGGGGDGGGSGGSGSGGGGGGHGAGAPETNPDGSGQTIGQAILAIPGKIGDFFQGVLGNIFSTTKDVIVAPSGCTPKLNSSGVIAYGTVENLEEIESAAIKQLYGADEQDYLLGFTAKAYLACENSGNVCAAGKCSPPGLFVVDGKVQAVCDCEKPSGKGSTPTDTSGASGDTPAAGSRPVTPVPDAGAPKTSCPQPSDDAQAHYKPLHEAAAKLAEINEKMAKGEKVEAGTGYDLYSLKAGAEYAYLKAFDSFNDYVKQNPPCKTLANSICTPQCSMIKDVTLTCGCRGNLTGELPKVSSSAGGTGGTPPAGTKPDSAPPSPSTKPAASAECPPPSDAAQDAYAVLLAAKKEFARADAALKASGPFGPTGAFNSNAKVRAEDNLKKATDDYAAAISGGVCITPQSSQCGAAKCGLTEGATTLTCGCKEGSTGETPADNSSAGGSGSGGTPPVDGKSGSGASTPETKPAEKLTCSQSAAPQCGGSCPDDFRCGQPHILGLSFLGLANSCQCISAPGHTSSEPTPPPVVTPPAPVSSSDGSGSGGTPPTGPTPPPELPTPATPAAQPKVSCGQPSSEAQVAYGNLRKAQQKLKAFETAGFGLGNTQHNQLQDDVENAAAAYNALAGGQCNNSERNVCGNQKCGLVEGATLTCGCLGDDKAPTPPAPTDNKSGGDAPKPAPQPTQPPTPGTSGTGTKPDSAPEGPKPVPPPAPVTPPSSSVANGTGGSGDGSVPPPKVNPQPSTPEASKPKAPPACAPATASTANQIAHSIFPAPLYNFLVDLFAAQNIDEPVKACVKDGVCANGNVCKPDDGCSCGKTPVLSQPSTPTATNPKKCADADIAKCGAGVCDNGGKCGKPIYSLTTVWTSAFGEKSGYTKSDWESAVEEAHKSCESGGACTIGLPGKKCGCGEPPKPSTPTTPPVTPTAGGSGSTPPPVSSRPEPVSPSVGGACTYRYKITLDSDPPNCGACAALEGGLPSTVGQTTAAKAGRVEYAHGTISECGGSNRPYIPNVKIEMFGQPTPPCQAYSSTYRCSESGAVTAESVQSAMLGLFQARKEDR